MASSGLCFSYCHAVGPFIWPNLRTELGHQRLGWEEASNSLDSSNSGGSLLGLSSPTPGNSSLWLHHKNYQTKWITMCQDLMMKLLYMIRWSSVLYIKESRWLLLKRQGENINRAPKWDCYQHLTTKFDGHFDNQLVFMWMPRALR